MKKLFFILSIFASTLVSAKNEYMGKPEYSGVNQRLSVDMSGIQWRWYTTWELRANSDGVLVIDGSVGIQPGDLVYMRPHLTAGIRAVLVYEINGNAANRISYSNYPGEQLYINMADRFLGDGRSYGTGIQFERCKYFNLYGTTEDRRSIFIQGSLTGTRANFFGIIFWDRCAYFNTGNITIRDGGTGLQMKTEIVMDSMTWYGRTVLDSVLIEKIDVKNSGNEAFYIGSTAIYRNPQTGEVYQPNNWNDPLLDTVQNSPSDYNVYKRAIRVQNVVVKNCNVDTSGNDAYQFANIWGLTMFGCTATQWALNGAQGHLSGILVGGGIRNSVIYNCVLMNSTNGEGITHFAERNGHTVTNVVVYNVGGNLIFIKGGEHLVNNSNYQVTFTNVTVSTQPTWGVGARISGQFGGTGLPMVFNKCLFANPGDGNFGGYPNNPRYYYTENGASYSEGTGADANAKYNTNAAADIDVNNYCQPNRPSSPVTTQGYRSKKVSGIFK